MSNTADILHSLYGQDFYPQEVSVTKDIIDNETLHDIWIEIEPDGMCPVSTAEGFGLWEQ